ncbi:ankyrin repeat domain-containing protein [Acaryochloris marina]|uniref:ankyrin repeat domain-containing protein n=1 Tax=Acaryochloris marina TaxID=155978 RepID=UPI001BAE9C38|nr:ankyrin repeat domain-containing protein [Acaryochloris marina]QUY43233.1 ankyrin repeat domain-containing protein [Acaryochloris marina S15]
MKTIDSIEQKICRAILANNVLALQQLIEQGADVNIHYRAAERLTPLIQAINLQRVEIVDMLLLAGADVHQSQYEITMPLWIATDVGNLDIVKLLLNSGANPNYGDVTSAPLHLAIAKDTPDIVEALIQAHADLNRTCALGYTPLMTAVSKGNLMICKRLVKTGAIIDIHDDYGDTALTISESLDHQDIVNFLQSNT